jgi:hypothetical protein
MSFTVLVGFDEAEHRYYVIESDIPGLHVETETFEEFVEVTKDFAPDLLGGSATGRRSSSSAKSPSPDGRQSLPGIDPASARRRLRVCAERQRLARALAVAPHE